MKPGDLVRVYNYTHKRREAMRIIGSDPNRQHLMHPHLDYDRIDGHKLGLIMREYPLQPEDVSLTGGYHPDGPEREWCVLLSGGCQAGDEIIVNENRLEKV
jgi:hypothetical protein|tara:strand:- start:280 stop:582 length:303 start_codon:yes stop_codon:yes gene_type:complete